MRALTCVVLEALAGVAPLSAATHTVGSAGFRVAEVNLRLTVVSGEAGGTAAAQPGDGMDGSEQDGVWRNKRRQAVKLQHGHTLHVVLARLAKADVVIKGKNFLGGNFREEAAVQVQPLLELLRAEELSASTFNPSPRLVPCLAESSRPLVCLAEHGHGHRQADVEDSSADIRVVLDVKDDDVFRGGRQDAGHAIQELGEQQGEEMLLGGVGHPQCDAVRQHFIGDDGDLEEALRWHWVDAIWGKEHGKGRMINIRLMEQLIIGLEDGWLYSSHLMYAYIVFCEL